MMVTVSYDEVVLAYYSATYSKILFLHKKSTYF